MQKAWQVLHGEGDKLRRRDLFRLSFFAGGTFVLLVLMVFGLIMEIDIFNPRGSGNVEYNKSSKAFWLAIKASNPIFRFTFMIGYILFAIGVCIQVFRLWGINYIYIF